MSGTGKSTLLRALADRGYLAVDTDYDGWTLPDGLWDEPRMSAFLTEHPTVVSGTVENQGRFYDVFDAVVLLSAPVEVLLERVGTRTTNPYGQTASRRLRSAGISSRSSHCSASALTDKVATGVALAPCKNARAAIGNHHPVPAPPTRADVK